MEDIRRRKGKMKGGDWRGRQTMRNYEKLWTLRNKLRVLERRQVRGVGWPSDGY